MPKFPHLSIRCLTRTRKRETEIAEAANRSWSTMRMKTAIQLHSRLQNARKKIRGMAKESEEKQVFQDRILNRYRSRKYTQVGNTAQGRRGDLVRHAAPNMPCALRCPIMTQ
eukprot:3057368-Rhodomonas_salina.1